MSADTNPVGLSGDTNWWDSRFPATAALMLRHRANHILVDMASVHGCIEVEKLVRIPGAPKGVRGLILFKGEPVPLFSFFEGSAERSTRKRLTHAGKTDDYAIIFSVRGTMFAAGIDEPPRVCADKSAVETAGGNVCRMRARHIQRLFDIYVARATDIAGDTDALRVKKDSEVKNDRPDRSDSEVTTNPGGVDQKTPSSITGPCCAA